MNTFLIGLIQALSRPGLAIAILGIVIGVSSAAYADPSSTPGLKTPEVKESAPTQSATAQGLMSLPIQCGPGHDMKEKFTEMGFKPIMSGAINPTSTMLYLVNPVQQFFIITVYDSSDGTLCVILAGKTITHDRRKPI